MNEPLSLITAAFALLLAVVLGRGVERHVTPLPQVPMVATSLCAGLGLWTLAWLAFVPLGGGHTIALAPLVFLAALALAGNHLRRWSRDKSYEEHYWSLPITHTLLLAPWLPLLWAAGPATLTDFNTLHTLTTLAAHTGWPTTGAQPFVGGTPGWHIVHLLPATVTAWAGQASIPATMVLSFFAVLALASLIPAIANTPVRWSNLPLVAAPALLVTLGFFFMILPLPAATPGLLLAPLALAVGALPILRAGPLPVGWVTLPHALSLAWLATLHPLGVPASIVIAILWLGIAIYKHGLRPGMVLTATLLITLPTLAVLFLAHALWPWQVFTVTSVQSALQSITAMVPWPFQGALWLQVLHLFAFMLLAIPIRLAMYFYNGSPVARGARRNPWFYALPLVALAVSAGMSLQPSVVVPPAPIISYAQSVATDLQSKKLTFPNQPIAVVGLPPVAVAALQYHLPTARVNVVSETTPLSTFHSTMRNQGYTLLWMGAGAAQTLFRLPNAPAASLVAQTTESGLAIRAIYPMPQAR